MAKAEKAAQSAKLLYQSGDNDGACNRAYYAMFDAARAALMSHMTPPDTNVARTHSGLISAFSLNLVKPGHVPVDYGKMLNRAHEIRLIADYSGEPAEIELVEQTVQNAEIFVSFIRKTFLTE